MERISQKCWQLILGTLLGDAWLTKIKKDKRKNSYLGICHSIKQEEYLLYKFDILKEIGANTIIDKSYIRNGKTIKSKEFVTKSLPILTLLRKRLYPNNKKTITKKFLNKLTAEGLSYWIMDDGSLVWHKRKRKVGLIYSSFEFYLATNCFSQQEIILIQEWLKEKFKVNSKLRYHISSKSFYLVINKPNYEKLATFIKPFIHKSMNYKVDFSKLGKLVEMTTNPHKEE